MDKSTSVSRLAELDKQNADAQTLLKQAAETANLGQSNNKETYPKLPVTRESVGRSTFREQYVLRWLVKKISQDVEVSTEEAPKPTSFVLNQTSWKLLYRLLYVIPSNQSLEILVERKFYSVLDQCIAKVIKHCSNGTAGEHGPTEKTFIQNAIDQRPTKRRRLSPVPASHHAKPVDIPFDFYELAKSLKEVCIASISLTTPAERSGIEATRSATTTWTPTSQESTSFFANVFRLSSNLQRSSTSFDKLSDLEDLDHLITNWRRYLVHGTGASSVEQAKLFNAQALSPILEVMELCQRDPHRFGKVVRALEELLALSTVLPARELFGTKHARKWKQERQLLSWADIEAICDDIQNLIFSPDTDVRPSEMTSAISSTRAMLPCLFDIAIRIIPRANTQDLEAELPWLEAFMLSLAYITNPELPKMITVKRTNLAPLDEVLEELLGSRADILQNLLQIAIDREIRLSLQVLGYLTSASLSWMDVGIPIEILARLVKLDVNVLISGSGVKLSDACLEEFVHVTANYLITEAEYSMLRDEVVIPILRGFARSRALKDITLIWQENLQEALRVQTQEAPRQGELPAVLVWQDEDLFKEYQDLVKSRATPALFNDLLSTLLPELKAIGNRVGSTLDISAKIAIFTSVLFVDTEDTVHLSDSELSQLSDAANAAIERRSNYQSQRWRLWNLWRALRKVDGGTAPGSTIFSSESGSAFSCSLNELLHVDADSFTEWPAARYRESVERFALLVECADVGVPDLSELLSSEVDSLRRIMKSQKISGLSNETSTIWNGRVSDMNSLQKLASACLGVLMAHPGSLSTCGAITETLSRQFTQSIMPEPTDRVPNHLSEVLDAFVQMDHIDNEAIRELVWKSFTQKQHAAQGVSLSLFLQPVSSKSLKRSQLHKFADASFNLLKAGSVSKELDQLAVHLALLEDLSSRGHVPWTEPGSWSSWVDILEKINYVPHEREISSLFVCVRCVTMILTRLWAHVLQSKEKDEYVRQIHKWCKNFVDGSEFVWGVSPFLALSFFERVLAEHLNDDQAKIKNQYQGKLSKSAQKLAALDSSNLLFRRPELYILLRALTTTRNLSPNMQLATAIKKFYVTFQDSSSFAETTSYSTRWSENDDLALEVSTEIQRYCQVALQSIQSPQQLSQPSQINLDVLRALNRFDGERLNQGLLAYAARVSDDFVKTLSAFEKAEVLEVLEHDISQDRFGLAKQFARASIALRTTAQDLVQYEKLVYSLAHPAYSSFQRFTSFPALLLDLEYSRLILDLHPRIVNQACLDGVLASVHSLLVQASPSRIQVINFKLRPDQCPDDLYERICSILGSIFSRHRRRLSDRHHILLPILQALLRCLFFPGTLSMTQMMQKPVRGSNTGAFLNLLPTWLSTSSAPLSAISARRLSRVLSSICNPTVSAARSASSASSQQQANGKAKSNGQGLNDATKRVKAIAGQHMQYFVMEYCRCTLDGHITAEVKEKLMPGLYVVLDAIEQKLMRAMNAAMNPSERAIFKGLYEDYRRYGRWNHD